MYLTSYLLNTLELYNVILLLSLGFMCHGGVLIYKFFVVVVDRNLLNDLNTG